MPNLTRKTRRRVLFFTEAGDNIGFGHLFRCAALAQAFNEKVNDIGFYVAGNSGASDLIPFPCNTIDWKDQLVNDNDLKHDDIIVIDSYLANLVTYQNLREKVATGIYIDDYNRIDYPPGFVVNGQPLAHNLGYKKSRDITYLLGGTYQPLRKAFWGVKSKGEIQQSILVIMGGNDIRGILPRMVNEVVKKFPDFKINVVIGNNDISSFSSSTFTNLHLHYNLNDLQMCDLMNESYMALSAAGQTLFELAATGTPTVAIGVADNQVQNIKSFRQSKFIEFAGWYDDEKIIDSAISCLRNLLNKNRYDISKNAGLSSIDGLGCRRIVEKVLDEIG